MTITEVDAPLATLALARHWASLMVVGLITIALGIAVVVWPGETLAVLSIILGIQFLIFGLWRLISAFDSSTNAPVLMGFVGILMMASGVIILRHPFETVTVLATILGMAWIIAGAIDLIGSFTHPIAGSKALSIIGALISIAAGVIVVAWPSPTLTVIAWIAGLYLIIIGIMIAVGAIGLRSDAKQLTGG